MEELAYIGYYYRFLLVFLLLVNFFTFFTYLKEGNKNYFFLYLLSILIIVFTILYVGGRSEDIGVDTSAYLYAYNIFASKTNFEVRKDVFYDLLSYFFSRFSSFNGLLTFCASLYIGVATIAFYNIFRKYGVYALTIFLISPNFFQFGINVMRNGLAASIFLFGLSLYYLNPEKKIRYYGILFLSILFHASMAVPFLVFFITKHFKNTRFLIAVWLLVMVISILNVPFINVLLKAFSTFGDSRAENYAVQTEEVSTLTLWVNFLFFKAIPVYTSIYFYQIRKFRDPFFVRILNIYLILSSLYVLAIKLEFAIRFAYLSEFLTPILLLYPFVYDKEFKMRFKFLKLSVFFLLIFLIKSVKVFFPS